MKFDEEKLKKELNNIPTIDFDNKQEVTSSIVVTIFQYPYGGRCSSASGICKVVSKFVMSNKLKYITMYQCLLDS